MSCGDPASSNRPHQIQVPVGKCSVELYSNPKSREDAYTCLIFNQSDQEDFLKAVLYVRYHAKLFRQLLAYNSMDKVMPLSIEDYKKALIFIDNVQKAVEWARNYGWANALFIPRMLAYSDPTKNRSWVEIESVYYLYFIYMEKTLHSLKHSLDTGFTEPFYGYDENHDEDRYVFIMPFDKRHWNKNLWKFFYCDINTVALPFDNINAVSIDTVDYYEAMFFNYRTHSDGKPSDELPALPS